MDPNYKNSTPSEIEAITRPQMTTLIKQFRKLGLADYARSRPVGHSIKPHAFECTVDMSTAYGKERAIITNLCVLAYMTSYNRRYLD